MKIPKLHQNHPESFTVKAWKAAPARVISEARGHGVNAPRRVFVGSPHDKEQEERSDPGHGDDPGIARKSGAGRARGFVICHLSSVTATRLAPAPREQENAALGGGTLAGCTTRSLGRAVEPGCRNSRTGSGLRWSRPVPRLS